MDIFGKPHMGFHAARIPYIDIALWDTVGTIVIALVIAHVYGLTPWKVVACAFLLGIILHWFFGVKTTVNNLLTNNNKV
jgi:hypothetical protein